MQLSHSSIFTYLMCGEFFRREKIEGEFLGLTSPNLARGTGVHAGARMNFEQKKESQVDLPRAEIVDASAEGFRDSIQNTEGFGLWLSPEEKSIGKGKVLGQELDRTARLAGLFADDLAPKIQPEKVEAYAEIKVTDDLSFRGYIDVIENRRVRDLKTSVKSKSAKDVEVDFQLTAYAVLYKAIVGEWPEALAMDTLVDKKTPAVQTLTTTRDESDARAWLETVVQVYNQIEAGIFPRAPLGSWKCGPKWCPAWSSCKYVGWSAERRLAGLSK